MRIFNHLLSSVLLLAAAHSATAGVVIGGTRVIYPEGKNEVSVQVKNPDKNTDYLVQSWLENADEKNTAKVPFVITPPLFRLNHDSDNALRIANTASNLPKDRESLYWLSVKSIAGQKENKQTNQLQIALRSRIKFIYRPAALDQKGAEEAYKSLTFSHQGGELLIKNPTPYYVSFYSLKVGGKAVDLPGMVAPFAEHRVKAAQSGTIEWQAINDYGGYTPVTKK
ncbi:molecular chaperone [Pantoea sp.]|uniref:fimbrial biogenesis chaperone n=1 Tax=Pantoea sp. TaxID=69393 RepID=UPI0031D853F8